MLFVYFTGETVEQYDPITKVFVPGYTRYWVILIIIIIIIIIITRVKNDHRSEFSNLSNWKEEA